MTTGTDDRYLTELAELLRAERMPEDRIEAVVGELIDHLDATGVRAEDEFGPLAEFAASLTGGPGVVPTDGGGPAEDAEEWRWVADYDSDLAVLDRYGRQGWEVRELDRLGRFVARRDRGAAMAWEYRREVVSRRRREERTALLAPEGWEPCGSWRFVTYYKRPLAASLGPDAALPDPPAGPRDRTFLSRGNRIGMVVGAVSLVVLPFLLWFAGDDPGVWIGGAVGGVIGGVAAVVGVRRSLRRGSGERPATEPELSPPGSDPA
ncbi:hypothetical protein [Streptomyces spiramenti]|uniref:DUF2812 domain-containing protein n=1 Tax=Streptomyces spiramenti TaxID=2720606 RepID=A0ABX1AQS7_9ACTN|nr:hypothetical protein [Streptomyces spiramenti]NJP68179.1 hypothetical protein [Streptomyces spiramenti]